jgi:NTE family protein
MSDERQRSFALVLSGGGARGAYEAGVIYYLRTHMPPEIAGGPLFRIYSGTSVGAINCAFLAASAHDPLYQGQRLRALWQNLTSTDIYHTDVRALAGFLIKTGLFTATNFFGLNSMVAKAAPGGAAAFPFRSVLDTTPFISFLRRNVNWVQMHRNIQHRIIDGITVSATHVLTGQLALFLEKHADVVYRSGGHFPIACMLSPKHILASAAIPLIFPIIRINRQYYGDGSLRQNTPMSPAIHLGADHLLVISLHTEEFNRPIPIIAPTEAEGEPKISDILGRLLNTIFLDKLDYDLSQMKRINFLIRDIEASFGANAVEVINAERRERRVRGKEINPVRKVVPFVIRPSLDIGVIAFEQFERLLRRKETLSPVQKFFARVVEGTPAGHNDFISYLLFEPDYLNALIDLGFEDARRSHDHLVNFFSGKPLDAARVQS